MTHLRRRLRSFTWLALFAMLGLALAPTVSNALDAQKAFNPWAEVCSASDSGEQPRSATMLLAHCALCVVAANAVGMPPARVAVLPVPEGVAWLVVLDLEAPRPALVWRASQARAPPRRA